MLIVFDSNHSSASTSTSNFFLTNFSTYLANIICLALLFTFLSSSLSLSHTLSSSQIPLFFTLFNSSVTSSILLPNTLLISSISSLNFICIFFTAFLHLLHNFILSLHHLDRQHLFLHLICRITFLFYLCHHSYSIFVSSKESILKNWILIFFT